LTFLLFNSCADRFADGDSTPVGASIEAADSVVGTVVVGLSRSPTSRLGFLWRAPVLCMDHRASLGLGDILADFVLHPFRFRGADFLWLFNILAVVLALVLQYRVTDFGTRFLCTHFVLHCLVTVNKDSCAHGSGSRGDHRWGQGGWHFHWCVWSGDSTLIGAAVETADSIVWTVEVRLSRTPAGRLGLLG